jgi:hypothetical protein
VTRHRPVGAAISAPRVAQTQDSLERTSQGYSARLQGLLDEFDGSPLPVSARQLAGPMERDMMLGAHAYPGRLLRQVPRFLIGANQLSRPADVVYDPFCGSGTVLVEAQSWGRVAWGSDINPLAALMSEVKVTPIDHAVAIEHLHEVAERAKRMRASIAPDLKTLDYWFTEQSLIALNRIRNAIRQVESERHRRWMTLALSAAFENLAHKDARIPVPVRPRDSTPSDVPHEIIRRTFVACATRILRGLPSSHEDVPAGLVKAGDSRDAGTLFAPEGVKPQLILTSPPYGAAQKYIRSSAISLVGTGLVEPKTVPILNRTSIGREYVHLRDRKPSVDDLPGAIQCAIDSIRSDSEARSEIYRVFFSDMFAAFRSTTEMLAPGGHYVLISSDNTVARRQLSTHALLADLLSAVGLKLRVVLADQIAGRRLLTKRAATAGPVITTEYIYIFEKQT